MLLCIMFFKIFLITTLSMNAFSLNIDNPEGWRGVTDQVMGGKSVLSIDHEDGIFYMKGSVTTENNGGFVRVSNSFRGFAIQGLHGCIYEVRQYS